MLDSIQQAPYPLIHVEDSHRVPTWLHQFNALEVILNWYYHLQLKSDIDKFLAKLFLELARDLLISI